MLFMRALLLLLLLLLLLCVTERKRLTDVEISTGQNTKKRGPRESLEFRLKNRAKKGFCVFPSFFFKGFLICLTFFFLYSLHSHQREKGILE